MAVVSSFDQWEKDVFFSAAEGVQDSADVMESLYRTWHHGCTSGICTEDLEELERELQAALGTAKWQSECTALAKRALRNVQFPDSS